MLHGGNSSFYATGSEPGVGSLNIPTALLAAAGQVDSYRMDEYALGLDIAYPIWDVLHESMGFGKPDGHVPHRIASGKVRHDWEPVVRYIADLLTIDLEQIDLDWETIIAPEDLDTEVGVINRNHLRTPLAARRDPRQRSVISVQYFATVSTTPWPESWPRPAQPGQGGMVFRIEGNPNMTLDLRLDPAPDDTTNPGVAATAMAAINAIRRSSTPHPDSCTCHWPVRRSSRVRLAADMTRPKAVDLYYDPFDFAIDDDPYPVWRRLREEAPLYYNEQHDFYALSRWDDVARELPNWQTYRSGRGTVMDVIKSGLEVPPGVILFEDPPQHDLHRRLLSKVFTPRRMAAIEPLTRQFCVRALDSLSGQNEFDVVADLGAMIPMRTIGYLLGIPEQGQQLIRDTTNNAIDLKEGQFRLPTTRSKSRICCSPSTSTGGPTTPPTTS